VEWDRLHSVLVSAGIPLPIESYSEFPIDGRHQRVLFGVQTSSGQWLWGGVADVGRSRVIPWRSVIRVHRVGRAIPADLLEPVVAVYAFVSGLEKALRLHVELSDCDASTRVQSVEAFCLHGYRAVAEPRLYSSTILVDLKCDEADLLASFHSTCRRHIRGLVKFRLQCETITDQRLADRLTALDAETMGRTGGTVDALSWPDMLRFVSAYPNEAVVLGVRRADVSDESALVGYVLGVRHGDTIEYRRAGSTRLGDLRAPLLYAPTWELMRWGKNNGARWFDFGGVADGSHSSGEATGGISDFKRYFSNKTTEIGAELIYTPSPHLDRLARAIPFGIALLAGAFRRK